MKLASGLLVFFSITAFTSCADADQTQPDTSAAPLYVSATISGEEGIDSASFFAEFRTGGPQGSTLLLPPAGVQLDGNNVLPDSARMAGFFYEARLPLAGFSGKHRLQITNLNGVTSTVPFGFAPFSLKNQVSQVLAGQPLTLQFGNLPAGTHTFRIIITDTAFETNDVHTLVNTASGNITLQPQQLSPLAAGPLLLEISKEEAVPVTGEGIRGKLVLHYNLRRNLELLAR